MVHFDTPFDNHNNNNYCSKTGKIDPRSVHPCQSIEGAPTFIVHRSFSPLQQQISWLESNGAMPFGLVGLTAKTEKGPHIKMVYPVLEFFDCHKNFAGKLNNLISEDSVSRFEYSNFYDPISDIISEYDQNLIHLPEDILSVFFNFTNVIEGVLLVSKKRQIDIRDIKDIFVKLKNVYNKIYSLMTLRNCNDISSIMEEISLIKEEIGDRGLLPTVEECEEEIEQTFAAMSNEEKTDLARILGN